MRWKEAASLKPINDASGRKDMKATKMPSVSVDEIIPQRRSNCRSRLILFYRSHKSTARREVALLCGSNQPNQGRAAEEVPT